MARLAKRGEIWMIDLGMAAKVRPCLVLSVPFEGQERALITYIPRTTSLRGGRFEVEHLASQFKPGAFDAQNIGTVPPARLLTFLSVAGDAVVERVDAAVCSWLGVTH